MKLQVVSYLIMGYLLLTLMLPILRHRVVHGAWTVMGYLWIACLITIQVRLEESHLIRSHGGEYLDYAGRTGRFLPAVGLLKPEKGGQA